MTPFTDDELLEIENTAYDNFKAWNRPSVRGQAIMPQDSLHYWVIQATYEVAWEKFQREYVLQ